MACFIVPATEAVVAGVAAKVSDKKKTTEVTEGLTWGQKMGILTKMLAGGAVLLCFEHGWHGEVTPFFPFLTAMDSKAAVSEMLHEMATVGVTMSAIVTVAWGGICAAADYILKKSKKEVA